MKKITTSPLFTPVILGVFFVAMCLNSNAQQSTNNVSGSEAKKKLTEYNPPAPFATCGNMGGESGWNAWVAETGTYANGVITVTTTGAPAAPRFALTTAGTDACTPGTLATAPPLPMVAPGFGTTSIQLGQTATNGLDGGCGTMGMNQAGCAERITYPFQVTAADSNFIYSYAIVIENPVETPASHSKTLVPYAEIYILAQNGDTVECSHQKYSGSTTGTSVVQPGFYAANCNGPNNNGMDVVYKPWTTVGINLNKYVGQTLRVVITNVDCGLGGHFCHSYWDFACPPINNVSPPYCEGNSTTFVGPPSDPANPYTYTWYQNGTPYTGLPGATSVSITPTPLVGDVYAVHVHQKSGCDFWVPFLPTPMKIVANITGTGSCGTFNFNGTATTTPASTPVASWNWSFPGATPSSSTVQNPTGITYSANGTYSVTLIAISQGGCKDTVTMTVTVANAPKAEFLSTPVCPGNPTQFTNNSVGDPADPISTYTWSFPGGNPASSNTQNPVVIYPPGNYTATLIVTSQGGCTSIVTHPVVVNPAPVAVPGGNNVCFNNQTVFTDLSVGNNTITKYEWDFGDGNTSNSSTPPTHTYASIGTYSVNLIITNNSGCKDTASINVIVHPLPVANFSSTIVCFGNPTDFSDLSTIASGNITGWSWNFGDPTSGLLNTSLIQSPTHLFTSPGNYMVILTVTSDNNCQSTVNFPVSFNPPPVASFTVTSVCLNTVTNFTSTSTSPTSDPIAVWDWDFGDGSPNSSSANPSHMYTTPGNYTATLIVTTAKGCKDTIPNPVVVYGIPIANYTDPAKGCAPVCTTFKDISVAVGAEYIVSWEWTTIGGSPETSNAQHPSFCWTVPGTYDVQLIVTSIHGCKDTLFTPQYVNVYAWPTADFCVVPAVAPTANPIFAFCDIWSANVTQWAWDFGDGSPIDNLNTDPIHSYAPVANANDFYAFNICLRVQTQYGCWDTACHVVELLPEFTFYIPNTVTPNGDGINDVFFGKSRGVKEYNIWIFDRWGNLIWDCSHIGKNTDWDRSMQDGMSSFCKWDSKVEPVGADLSGGSKQRAQEDVYVWKVKLLDIFDKQHVYIGHVNIVR